MRIPTRSHIQTMDGKAAKCLMPRTNRAGVYHLRYSALESLHYYVFPFLFTFFFYLSDSVSVRVSPVALFAASAQNAIEKG